MENLTIAVVQQRMSIPPTHDEFEAMARRFLRQAQAKAAQLTIFPELTGVMLAPPLISGFKRSFIQRGDQGKHPAAGIFSRSMGRLAGTTGGAVGGGFRGSVERLLRKRNDEQRGAYVEMFGRLVREYSTGFEPAEEIGVISKFLHGNLCPSVTCSFPEFKPGHVISGKGVKVILKGTK